MRIDVVLPLPFGPEEAEDLAARDRERQVDDDVLVAEALVEVVDVDDGAARRSAIARTARIPPALMAQRTLTGCPGMQPPRPRRAGRASTMNTSLLRVSLL